MLKSFTESAAFAAEITIAMTRNAVNIPKTFELNLKLSPVNNMINEIKKIIAFDDFILKKEKNYSYFLTIILFEFVKPLQVVLTEYFPTFKFLLTVFTSYVNLIFNNNYYFIFTY